ncbi:DUF5777 family beta-barrel protein [Solitalea sp. MAHUQ-68]|uniref:DUF5777 family beta-barrel protein n=1 Tax=Solitalea agri TaxID=2953739 RepID=A0A9X2EZY2_9SPHI|nr:DUF5777 family beta-barrel protein [Solitalea agri]MCO4291681.1 DUF5777 family beta-barrel protein [Solitalea agri]
MKNLKTTYSKSFRMIFTTVFLFKTLSSFAQDDSTKVEDSGNKPVRSAFESTWIIDNQTTLVPQKGTLEFMINHRFGTVYNGLTDLYGMYGAGANIRLGINYSLLDNIGFGKIKGTVAIGYGITKTGMVNDFNLKYGILNQTRNGKIPISVTYYFDMGLSSANKKDDLPNGNNSDRLSFFHQIIVSRKFNDQITIQVAPSLSHFNTVEPSMQNDFFAVAVSGRYKFTEQTSLLLNYDQPITEFTDNNPQFNVSAGVEIATSAHQFQIFISNFPNIVPQYNNVYNQPNSQHKWYQDLYIGFNITRLWSF